MSTAVDVARGPGLAHLEAWSSADPAAVAGSAAEFSGPGTGRLSGPDLHDHATVMLPRLGGRRFVVRDVLHGEHGCAIAWTLPAPTAGVGAVEGVDELRIGPAGLTVRRRFDPAALAGPDTAASPDWQVGTATRHRSGRAGVPGALALTRLSVTSPAESEEVDMLSVQTVRALWASRGVLGVATFDVGAEKYTITAFDDVDAVRAVHSRAHQRAMRKFFRSGLCRSAWTGVWTPVRVRAHERCPDCGTTVPAEPGGTCDCGFRPAPTRLF